MSPPGIGEGPVKANLDISLSGSIVGPSEFVAGEPQVLELEVAHRCSKIAHVRGETVVTPTLLPAPKNLVEVADTQPRSKGEGGHSPNKIECFVSLASVRPTIVSYEPPLLSSVKRYISRNMVVRVAAKGDIDMISPQKTQTTSTSVTEPLAPHRDAALKVEYPTIEMCHLGNSEFCFHEKDYTRVLVTEELLESPNCRLVPKPATVPAYNDHNARRGCLATSAVGELISDCSPSISIRTFFQSFCSLSSIISFLLPPSPLSTCASSVWLGVGLGSGGDSVEGFFEWGLSGESFPEFWGRVGLAYFA